MFACGITAEPRGRLCRRRDPGLQDNPVLSPRSNSHALRSRLPAQPILCCCCVCVCGVLCICLHGLAIWVAFPSSFRYIYKQHRLGRQELSNAVAGNTCGFDRLTIFVNRMVRSASSGVRLLLSSWETLGKSLGLSVPYSPPTPHPRYEVRGSRIHAVRLWRGA